MIQLWQQGDIRDYWGSFPPAAIDGAAPLNLPELYVPRWFSAPALADQVIASKASVETQLALQAGSYIWCFLHAAAPGNGFTFQITDLALRHPWFNTPIDDACIVGSPFYLPAPYEVVSPGLFRVEIWNTDTVNATQRCQIILGVAEPRRNVNVRK